MGVVWREVDGKWEFEVSVEDYKTLKTGERVVTRLEVYAYEVPGSIFSKHQCFSLRMELRNLSEVEVMGEELDNRHFPTQRRFIGYRLVRVQLSRAWYLFEEGIREVVREKGVKGAIRELMDALGLDSFYMPVIRR